MANKPVQLSPSNFSEKVKTWSYDKFMKTFSPVYPGANLAEIAAALGIKAKAENKKSD